MARPHPLRKAPCPSPAENHVTVLSELDDMKDLVHALSMMVEALDCQSQRCAMRRVLEVVEDNFQNLIAFLENAEIAKRR